MFNMVGTTGITFVAELAGTLGQIPRDGESSGYKSGEAHKQVTSTNLF